MAYSELGGIRGGPSPNLLERKKAVSRNNTNKSSKFSKAKQRWANGGRISTSMSASG
jgi:hypothetical protein